MLHIDKLLERFPWLNDISHSNIKILYVVRMLSDLLGKITLFFLPIYLFTLGKEESFLNLLQLTPLQNGLLTVALFYGLIRFVVFFTAIPLANLSHKVGFDMALVIAFSCQFFSMAALYFSKDWPVLIIVAAVFQALQINLFWNNFFTILSERLHRRWAGSELGVMQFIVQIVSVLAPALSGFLAIYYGFGVLFLMGGLIAIISAILIMTVKVSIPRDKVSWTEFGEWLRNPEFFKQTGSFIGRYINDAGLILWPLYVFLILGSVDRVGFLYTFSLFIAMILTFFIGNYLNHVKTKRPFYFSGGALSLVWVARSQVVSIWGIALADTVDKLVGNFHWLFYDFVAILGGKGREAFSYFVYREMIISIGAVLFWLVFASFFMVTSSWLGVFLFAGIGVLLSLLVSDSHAK